jgi:hypothetical protein
VVTDSCSSAPWKFISCWGFIFSAALPRAPISSSFCLRWSSVPARLGVHAASKIFFLSSLSVPSSCRRWLLLSARISWPICCSKARLLDLLRPRGLPAAQDLSPPVLGFAFLLRSGSRCQPRQILFSALIRSKLPGLVFRCRPQLCFSLPPQVCATVSLGLSNLVGALAVEAGLRAKESSFWSLSPLGIDFSDLCSSSGAVVVDAVVGLAVRVAPSKV